VTDLQEAMRGHRTHFAKIFDGPIGCLDISPFVSYINISMIGEATNALHQILDKA